MLKPHILLNIPRHLSRLLSDIDYLCFQSKSMINFDEYIRQGEPQKREKGYAWQTAIGLQAVDGLKPSEYLIETARKDIEGEITIDEAEQLIKSYYQSKEARTPEDAETHEADTASTNIRRLLTEKTFAFTLVGLTSIHRRIFDGVFKFAGQIRDYNITKKEWVLRGDTVLYVSAPDIRKAIEYDLEQERRFDYSKVDRNGLVNHIAQFVSGLWQIHPFGEGNTRTTAVFTILYLRYMGFDVTNDLFANHSWYFRNALVRANYTNLQKGVHATTKFLEMFFSNLLLGTNHDLKNRYMHVDFVDENISQSAKSETPKCQIDTLKCTLEELAVLDLIKKNPSVKQTELAEQTGKSVRSIKRITDSLKEKHYLRRVDGKRYGKWEVLA